MSTRSKPSFQRKPLVNNLVPVIVVFPDAELLFLEKECGLYDGVYGI